MIMKICYILTLFCIFSNANAANYYVDTDADDGGNGTTQSLTGPNCAWNEISDITGSLAGDNVYFNKGDTWRETLVASASGTVSNPIMFGAYGIGADPIISGANLITAWTEHDTNIWNVNVTTKPEVVLFDKHYGYRQTTLGGVNSEYDWYWESDVLYVYAASDPDTLYTSPGIESGARTRCLTINAKSYLIFDHIVFQTSNQYCVRMDGDLSNNTWTNCTFENALIQNFSQNYEDTESDILIEDCNSNHAGNWGIIFNSQSNWTLRRVTSYRDGIMPNAWSSDAWGGGLKCQGTGGDNIIENCTVTYAGERDDGYTPDTVNKGHGIWFDLSVATDGHENIAGYNNTNHNTVSGLYCEKAEYNQFYYNISYSNGEAGLRIGTDTADTCENNEFYNNTLYGNDIGIYAYNDLETADGAINNIFKNNISVSNTTRQGLFKDGFENDGTLGSGNVYGYNCFGAESSNFIEWGEDSYVSTYDAWETAYGGTTNSVESDPLFTDAENADFTLQSNSPCINAGSDVGLTVDYEGDEIIDNPDIGAYEYVTNDPNIQRTLSLSSTVGGSVANPGEGDFSYDDDSVITIQTAAAENYHFVNWTGTAVTAGKVANPNSASTTVTMDADYTIHANFVIDQHTLTLSSTSGGSVTNPGEGSFSYNDESRITIIASAGENYHFVNWTGTAVNAGRVANPNSASTTVMVDADYTIHANFVIDQHTLTLSSTSGGSVTNPGEGSFSYNDESRITIIASAGENYHFVNWTGTAVNAGRVANPNSASTTVMVDADYTIHANFVIDQHTLTLSSTSGGSVTNPGEGSFSYNDESRITIIASAGENYHFVNWTGTAVTAGKVANPNSANTTVTMDADNTIKANFVIDQDTIAPTISYRLPDANATQVPLDTIINITISDIGQGVDANTIRIRLEDELVYDGDSAESDGTYVSEMGTCKRVGSKEDYIFFFKYFKFVK